MSYEPLHHKYRPQIFAELVGQEAIATTLTNAVCQNKIAPAYLFTGPRGTGKTSSARILAKSLNCLASDRPTASPCGKCEVCQTITKGNSVDVIEIDAASNTGVENIRDIIERAPIAAMQCRYKVYLIDEVHMLSVAAFNALLKTLEEPPPHVIFVLATTDPQRVLPTIISRCQRYNFRRIPLEAMVQHLKNIAQKEKVTIADDALTLVAQIAQGGLRDAESLLDQLSLFEGEVTVETIWDLVGAVPEKDLMALLEAIDSENASLLIERARQIMDRGREPLVLLQNLASFWRDLLIAKTAPTRSDLVAITPPTWQQLCQIGQKWPNSFILAGQKHLQSSEIQIKNTTQPRLWLEVTLLGLLPSTINDRPLTSSHQPISNPTTTPKPSAPTEPPTQKTPESTIPFSSNPGSAKPATPKSSAPTEPPIQKTPESTISFSPNPGSTKPATPAPPPETSEANPPATSASEATSSECDLDGIWQTVFAHLELQPVRSLWNPQHCKLIEFNSSVARFTITTASLYDLAKKKVQHIEAAFLKALNQKVKVILEVEGDRTSKTTVAEKRPPRDEPPVPSSAPSEPEAKRSRRESGELPAPPASVEQVASDTNLSAANPSPIEPDFDSEEEEMAIAPVPFADAFNVTPLKLISDLQTPPTPESKNLDSPSLDGEEYSDMPF